MKYRITIACVLWVSAVVSSAFADTLGVHNGATYTGSLIRIVNGYVYFDTSLAGRVLLPADRVTYLATDRAFQLTFNDGIERSGRFGTDADGVHLAGVADQSPSFIALAAVTRAEVIESPPTPPGEAEGVLAGYRSRKLLLGDSTLPSSDAPTRLNTWNEAERYDFATTAIVNFSADTELGAVLRRAELGSEAVVDTRPGLSSARTHDSWQNGSPESDSAPSFALQGASARLVGLQEPSRQSRFGNPRYRQRLRWAKTRQMLTDLLVPGIDSNTVGHGLGRLVTYAYYADEEERADRAAGGLRFAEPHRLNLATEMDFWNATLSRGRLADETMRMQVTPWMRLDVDLLDTYEDVEVQMEDTNTGVGATLTLKF